MKPTAQLLALAMMSFALMSARLSAAPGQFFSPHASSTYFAGVGRSDGRCAWVSELDALLARLPTAMISVAEDDVSITLAFSYGDFQGAATLPKKSLLNADDLAVETAEWSATLAMLMLPSENAPGAKLRSIPAPTASAGLPALLVLAALVRGARKTQMRRAGEKGPKIAAIKNR